MPTLSFGSTARLVRYAVPAIFVLWMLVHYGVAKSQYDQVVRKLQSQQAVFIDDFLDHEIDGAFDGAGIDRLCETSQWIPGLVMSCDAAPGDVGEVRNAHLHCIRVAIATGAELILPEIERRAKRGVTRPAPDMTEGVIRGEPLSYFFDVDNLVGILSRYCPQMQIHRSIDELDQATRSVRPFRFAVRDFTTDFTNGTVLRRPQDLAKQFHGWLDHLSPPAERRYPLRVNMEATRYIFPVTSDDADVARYFGRILRVRQDARRIAGAALHALSRRFNLTLDLREPFSKASRASSSFLGIHLHTRSGSDDRSGPDYAGQASRYLEYLSQADTRVAYLATGSDDAAPDGRGGAGAGAHEEVLAVVQRSREFGVSVVTKWDLLSPATGPELEELRGMSWEQRALVDYEVMLRADEMVGAAESGFAWSLALRRAHALGEGLGISEVHRMDKDHGIQWRQDGVSTLYGEAATEKVMAMRLTTWP